MSRRSLVLGAGLVAAPAAPSSALAAADLDTSRRRRPLPRLTMTSAGMIQRRGRNFRAGGVNVFQLITNDYPAPHLTPRAEIDLLLLKAVRLGARVVRAHTLAASVGNPFTLVTGVSGRGSRPTIHYNPAVWAAIDYAAWRARQLGLYLIPPFVDELGYYHGGKRHWVHFRHPGSVSLDPTVKAATSRRQRAAENLFYDDKQVNWDFEQFIRDWLNHVNPMTGVAYKHDPVFSIVQVGNELWTAAQDARGWVAAKAALIKEISPRTLVMDSGADGLSARRMAWSSPDVDILETHPYSSFGPADVSRMARFAAAHGKAFAVGEYAWSKRSAPALEAVVRRNGNIFTSALWSLHTSDDLHNAGSGYGVDDAALYLPGKDTVQRRAAARIRSHHRTLARRADEAHPPRRPRGRSR